MDHHFPAFDLPFDDHRGQRLHRFMESSDINAAFREFFKPLRTGIRRGMSNEGQIYGIEMDACIPGEMLSTEWIPPATRGISDVAALADAARRRVLYGRLFTEARAESLFAYVCERRVGRKASVLYLEVVSVDAGYAAEYPIVAGSGGHRRELQHVQHRCLGPLAVV